MRTFLFCEILIFFIWGNIVLKLDLSYTFNLNTVCLEIMDPGIQIK